MDTTAPPRRPHRVRVGAVVLAGGTSRRMGGGDKTALDLRGRTVLDTLVSSLPDEWEIVCVGEPRPLSRDVAWTREHPPLSGPVSGLRAGVDALPHAEIVVTLAGDQPFSGGSAASCVAALGEAPSEVDGVAARQPDGRPQALLAAYRRGPLLAALTAAPVTNAGVYRTLSGLEVRGIDVSAASTLDVDTPADLAQARTLL